MADQESTRAEADDAWREGHLVSSRRAYQELLSQDPSDWRARAALASMDLAFGRLSPEVARALARSDLSRDAHDHVRSLLDAAENSEHETLPGAEADWDIDRLRVDGKNADENWWLAKGRAAWEVWLFGLAQACFEEASERWEALSFNPPRWAQVTLGQRDEYLRMLAEALPSP